MKVTTPSKSNPNRSHDDLIQEMDSLADILQFLISNKYAGCYTDMVQNHIIKDVDLVREMTQLHPSSVDHMFNDMKRQLLITQCKNEIKSMRQTNTVTTDRSLCSRCNIFYFYDPYAGANVCPQCGITIQAFGTDETYNVTNKSRFNINPVHHYVPSEHFYQTLLDITCTSRRKVPKHVMTFCQCVLGQGEHVTNEKVFNVLQIGGYSRYYASKYEIAARLRGTPEIILSGRETELVRMHYKRYARHMNTFQREHNLGTTSKQGKRRVFWPVRFIVSEMFKLIDRTDLIRHLRGVASKSRAAAYRKYWDLLRVWVDHTEPTSRIQTLQTAEHLITPGRLARRKGKRLRNK